MENYIKNYVEQLFSNVPATEQNSEIKEEIIGNTIDRYHSYLDDGLLPREACDKAVEGIGDLSEIFDASAKPSFPTELLVKAKERTHSLRTLGVLALVVEFIASLPLTVYGFQSAAVFITKALTGFGVGILVFAGLSKYLPFASDEKLRSLIKKRAFFIGTGVGLLSTGIIRVETDLYIPPAVEIGIAAFSVASLAAGIILCVLGAKNKPGKPDPALKSALKSLRLSYGALYRIITALIWFTASVLFITAISLTRGNMFTFLLFPAAVAAQSFARSCFERNSGRAGVWAAVTAVLLCASLITAPFSFTGGLLDNRPFEFSAADGKPLDESFDAVKIRNVKIDWHCGDVEVKPSESGRVEIYGEIDADTTAECSLIDGALTISSRKNSLFDIFTTAEQKLTVKIPDGRRFGEFELSSDAGDVKISAEFTTDNTVISTASGDISSGSLCSAELELNTASGNIDIAVRNHPDFGVGTNLTANSASGDLTVNGEFMNGKLNTASGNIRVEINRPGQTVSAVTVSGDTHFLLGASVDGFTLGYTTVSGKVRSNLGTKTPEKILYNENAEFLAELNAQSVSGSISVIAANR